MGKSETVYSGTRTF